MKKKKRRIRVLRLGILLLFTAFLAAVALIIIFNSRETELPMEYDEIIEKVAYEEGIADHVLYAVIYTESSFDKDAVSSAGAVGLMQLLPDTAEWLCGREGVEYSADMLTDPEFSIRYGTKYLMILYDRYDNWDAAHAAYNAGFTRVDSWLDEGIAVISDDGQLTGIPIASVDAYVNKIRETREKYYKQLEERKAQ